ncbi:unnamed protein product [Ectocarpus sp. 6 AP-2014]
MLELKNRFGLSNSRGTAVLLQAWHVRTPPCQQLTHNTASTTLQPASLIALLLNLDSPVQQPDRLHGATQIVSLKEQKIHTGAGKQRSTQLVLDAGAKNTFRPEQCQRHRSFAPRMARAYAAL